MRLKLITPKKSIIDESVCSVTLPGADGQITVLPGHDILVTGLKNGLMYYRTESDKSKKVEFAIGDGVAEVTKDSVSVLTSTASPIPVV